MKKFKLLLIIIILGGILGYLYYQNNYLDYNYINVTNTEDKEVLESLITNYKDNKDILYIVKHYKDYPRDLLVSLSKNIELLDFVKDYPNKKGTFSNNDIIGIDKSRVPLLLQWDERWGYATYGDNIIAVNGCAPTSLAMVLIYLTGDGSITPLKVANYAYKNNMYQNNVGTSWSLMTEGAKYYGVNSHELSLDKNVIYNALNNHHPIIASMRKGDFTDSGHFIVITKVEDDMLVINDPNSVYRSNKKWEYEQIKGQIKNLWEFY